jgi:hypothetical protein
LLNRLRNWLRNGLRNRLGRRLGRRLRHGLWYRLRKRLRNWLRDRLRDWLHNKRRRRQVASIEDRRSSVHAHVAVQRSGHYVDHGRIGTVETSIDLAVGIQAGAYSCRDGVCWHTSNNFARNSIEDELDTFDQHRPLSNVANLHLVDHRFHAVRVSEFQSRARSSVQE